MAGLSALCHLALTGCAPLVPGPQEGPALARARVQARWEAPAEPAPAGPLTAERAIREALAASPELEQIRRRVEAAGEQVRQAEAAFYPRVAFAQEYSVTNNPVLVFMQILNQRDLSFAMDFNDPGRHQNVTSRVQADWSLFEGGGRLRNREAALQQRHAAESELLAARNRLVASVTETYYRWLQALGFIRVADLALEAARTDERLGHARARAEAALPSELLRLRTRTAEARANATTAQTGARRLQAALERLLARPVRPEEVPDPGPAGSSDAPPLPPGEPGGLVDRALERRPELEGVRALILAARERLRAARGELLPKIGARAWYAWDSEALQGGGDSWLVGLQATWSLYQGGATLSRAREAQARLREMEARGEQMALDVALEVHQAALGVQEAAEKITVSEERRQWASRALTEVRSLYQRQVVNVDALLQAQVEWNRAEVAYTAALFDGRIAHTLLRQALGDFAQWTEVRGE